MYLHQANSLEGEECDAEVAGLEAQLAVLKVGLSTSDVGSFIDFGPDFLRTDLRPHRLRDLRG